MRRVTVQAMAQAMVQGEVLDADGGAAEEQEDLIL